MSRRRRPLHYIYRARHRYDPQEHPDAGANDEGYHWTYCVTCNAEKEHDQGRCLACNTDNASRHSQR